MGYIPHVKFEKDGEKFGVHHKGRGSGLSRNLILLKFDGDKWNRLEEESQEEATGAPVGRVNNTTLKK